MITTAPTPTFNVRRPLIAVLMLLGVLGGIRLAQHATERHGSEAARIRDCLERNSADQVWQSTHRPDVYAFCVELENGDGNRCGVFGILIAKIRKGGRCAWTEKTSFIPKSRGECGTPARVQRYLEKSFSRVE